MVFGLCLQDYDAMVKLVQTIEMLPTCDLAIQPMIQFHYAFALNRWPQICIVWYILLFKCLANRYLTYTALISGTHAFIFVYVCEHRRNSPGDREQALRVMLQVLQSCEHPAPDMFCLCGRIYKDIFLDSDCKDTKNRDNAIQWWVC